MCLYHIFLLLFFAVHILIDFKKFLITSVLTSTEQFRNELKLIPSYDLFIEISGEIIKIFVIINIIPSYVCIYTCM